MAMGCNSSTAKAHEDIIKCEDKNLAHNKFLHELKNSELFREKGREAEEEALRRRRRAKERGVDAVCRPPRSSTSA